MDFHGQLPPEEGRGSADLAFSIHGPGGGDPIWSETVRAVPLAPDGAYAVVLGREEPLAAALFEDGPRWMAVRVVRGGRPGLEVGPRVPIAGAAVRLAARVGALDARLQQVEAGLGDPKRLGRRVRILHRRLAALEKGGGALAPLQGAVGELKGRLDRVDAEDGRLDRLEHELDELVGQDGDIIDLLERMERVEGSGPVPRPAPPPPPPSAVPRMDPRFLAQIAERIENLGQRMAVIEQKLGKSGEVTADSIHAVKRGGDTMTGGLTINRGGLEVLSGGIKSRGADINTLEASIHVKTPRLIADGIELRGDLTVDSTRRTLQVRHVEGRSNAGRKDGSLMLNTRSGEAVVVGNAEQHEGLDVHGSSRATEGFSTRLTGLATWLDAAEPIEPGEVCAVNARGEVVRSTSLGQGSVVGVCVGSSAVVTGAGGEGRARVAWGGVVRVHVVGEVHPGDLLVASSAHGRACRADAPGPGSVLGKALGSARGESGEVLALLGRG